MSINETAVIASNRFGFGARPGDLSRIGDRPRSWLRQQVEGPTTGSLSVQGSREALQAFLSFRDKKRQQRLQGSDKGDKDVEDVRRMGQSLRPIYLEHVLARSVEAIETSRPFQERLVHFWSNHFAVSADKPQLLGLVGTLENEAIRPNVNGRFADMLMAVEKHPAMLTYLDNFQSIGPNSPMAKHAAKRKRGRKLGINENLAREILELHTLGVNGGYSQADVTAFARVISGWTYGGLFKNRAERGRPGEFVFNELMHEPGSQRIMNRRYGQDGIRQGEAVLNDLAAHPQTAQHLATKLARHFISDDPPQGAIEELSRTYLESNGDLPSLYARLLELDDTWRVPLAKYKSPTDFVYSVFRTIDFVPEKAQQLLGPLTVLGQVPFRPGSPAGWPDKANAWAGGEALFKRLEFAVSVARRVGNRVDPIGLSRLILGSQLSQSTSQALSRAESGEQGLALLFASPEFQRR